MIPAIPEPQEILTPEAAAALEALRLRTDWPKLSGGRSHGYDTTPEERWYVTLRRADGKRTWIYGKTLSAALLRAGEIAEEMARDAQRHGVVHA